MKKYSVCVQVWHKPDGMRSWHKLNVIYIPATGKNKTAAKDAVRNSFTSLESTGFIFTVKFANPFNPVYHK
jgi:hypothetical protein